MSHTGSLSRPTPLRRWQALARRVSRRRLLLGLLLCGCLFVAVWARLMPETVSLRLGDVADRAIVAPRSVSFVDTERT